MVDGAHRGEQVGGDARSPADGLSSDVLVGVRMAEGHLDARLREPPGGCLPSSALDSQRDHAQRRPACGDESFDRSGIGVTQQGGVVSTFPGFGQERTLQVDAIELTRLDEPPQDPALGFQLFQGLGHSGREQGGGSL